MTDSNKERNYWMFRVSERWGSRRQKCLDENFVHCGWNIGLSLHSSEEILKHHPWASRMAIKFTYIKPGDIIIMPGAGFVAVGKAIEKEYREDLDWKDTIKVEWLTKSYPRSDLSSRFQSSLKSRGTFLELWRYKNEIDELISKGFKGINEEYNNNVEKKNIEAIKNIAEHINSNSNTNFGDKEFEHFIKHLFEIHYEMIGKMNSPTKEKEDGMDLQLHLKNENLEDLDISIKLNIQVKQHEGSVSGDGIYQIAKSTPDDDKEDEKNRLVTRKILVTTGARNEEIDKIAEENNVYVFDCSDLAEIIFYNIEKIDSRYLAKLNLYKTVNTIT